MNLLLASYGMPPFSKLSRTDPQKRQTTRNILAPSDFFISFRISRCTGEPADFCSPRADVPKLSGEISGRKIDAGSGSPAFQDEGGPVLNKIFSHAVRASVLMPIGLSVGASALLYLSTKFAHYCNFIFLINLRVATYLHADSLLFNKLS